MSTGVFGMQLKSESIGEGGVVVLASVDTEVDIITSSTSGDVVRIVLCDRCEAWVPESRY